MPEQPPPIGEGAEEVQSLVDEVRRLRTALQSIATTLDSASDDSLRAASRIAKGMALTALSTPAPALARRPTTGGSVPRTVSGEVRIPKDDTQPGNPAFEEPQRPVSEGDRPVMIPPAREPSKKITEPSAPAYGDPTPPPRGKG